MNSRTSEGEASHTSRKPKTLIAFQVGALILGIGSFYWAARLFADPPRYFNSPRNPSLREVMQMVAFIVSFGVGFLAVSFGIWRNRTWSRGLMIALPGTFYAVQMLNTILYQSRRVLSIETFVSTIFWGIVILIMWSALYEHEPIRNYYESLETSRIDVTHPTILAPVATATLDKPRPAKLSSTPRRTA